MSDTNKKAVPKSHTDPAFERSTIVNRTPPGAQWETEQRDDSVYLCQICMVTDEVHKIRCDACTLWYHFVCAHVPNDAVDKEVWLCPECVKNRRSARIQPTNPVNAGSENQAHTVQMSQLVDVGENPAVTVAESNTTLRLENPAGQLTLSPPQVRKSNSTSSTMSRRTTLALQRLEEERRLNEQRDYEAREYLKKKYDILEDDVASNVSYDDEEISRYRLESIRQWTENVQESPLEADRITTTDVAQLHSTATVTQSGNDNMTSGAEAVDPVNVNVIQDYEEATTSANYQVEPLPDWLTNPRTVSQKPYPWSRSTQETSDLIVTSGQPISLSEHSVAKMKTSVQPHPHPWFSSLKSGPTNSTSQNLRPNGRSNAFIEPVTNVTSSMDQQALQYQSAGNNLSIGNKYVQPTLPDPLVGHSIAIGSTGVGQSFGSNQPKPTGFNRPTLLSTSVPMTVDTYQSQLCNVTRPVGINQPHSAMTNQTQAIELNHQAGQSLIASRAFNNQQPISITPTQTQNHSLNANRTFNVGQSFGTSQPQTFDASRSQIFGASQPQQMGTSQTIFTGQPVYSSQPNNVYQSYGFGQANRSTASTILQQSPISSVSLYVPVSNYNGANQSYLNGSVLNHGAVVNFPTPGRLTADQIAARHVMPKELPYFNGDPRQWQPFISAFENSTVTCGFSNSENLGRLQKCLKGDAEDAVKSRLLHADCVPGIIDTLRIMYGRPEFIIATLVEDVQKLPPPKENDLSTLIRYAISIQNLCDTIRNLRATEHLKNPMLINSIIDKLPAQHQLNWAFFKQTIIGNADISHLGDWLYRIADKASQVVRVSSKSAKKPDAQGSNNNRKAYTNKSNNFLNTLVENEPTSDLNEPKIESSTFSKKVTNRSVKKDSKKCPVCNQSSCQRVKDCKKFISLSSKERWEVVKEKELCIRCFGYHRFKSCRSKQVCNVESCQKAHNPLLHDSNNKVVKKDSKETSSAKSSDSRNVNCSHQYISRKTDVFRIVPVNLYHNGQSVQTFAYLDNGSNVTTMESDLADELNLERSANENLCVKWSFGKIRRTELVSSRVSVRISGVHANANVYDLHNVRTVTDLALPHQSISSKWLKSYRHLEGLPITTYENAKPRMLIGLQYSKLMVSLKTIEGSSSEPIACKTRLGWVVQGPDGSDDKREVDNYSINICECQHSDENDLQMLVKEFFSWDSYGVKIPDQLLESKDIQRARKILDSTTRKIEGRYETGLLWRFEDVEFPDSYSMALKRLECLERKMEKDPI